MEVSASNHVCFVAVEGMTCNSCVDLIHNAVSQLEGVNSVNVSDYCGPTVPDSTAALYIVYIWREA